MRLLLALLLVSLALVPPLQAQVQVDAFDGTYTVGPGDDDDATDVAGVLGGERDVLIDASGTTVQAAFAGGQATISDPGAGGASFVELIYDGNDNDGSTADFNGLGGVDLTAGGADGFTLSVTGVTGTVSLDVNIVSPGGFAQVAGFPLAVGVNEIPFSSFVGTVDFASVGLVGFVFSIDGGESVALDAIGAVVLPVELTRFDVVADGLTARLTWETASETNNAGFAVEHRGPEGQAWAEAGFVPGAGTTTTSNTYAFSVDGLAPGTHTFRLRQVDFDGAFAYSPEVEVDIALDGAFALSAAAPNPFAQSTALALSVAEAQHVTVALYDGLGRRAATLYDGAVSPQTPQGLTVEAAGLPAGVYLVVVRGETFRATRAITLAR